MPSAEGKRIARRAWDSYKTGVNTVADPLISPLAKSVSAATVTDLIGFWVVWHLHGGFEGLRDIGMSRAAIYRRTQLFRKMFGAHPDEFRMPGVLLDVQRYHSESQQWAAERATKSK